jgi:predicted phosphodiesterase
LRVAALYDIHGMPWPLEAVLEQVVAEPADAVLFGGDLLCGPYPRRTLELIQSVEGALFVRGNCEREPDDRLRAELESADVRWMAELPMWVTLDGVQYCHSTPDDDMPIVSAATPEEAVEELFRGAAEQTVVIGHTHHQFDRRAGGVRVVNAGSVGMPYEGEVAAFWTVVEDGEPSFRKTPFDTERAIAEVEASEWAPAAEFAAENLRVAVSREEAIAWYESRRSE